MDTIYQPGQPFYSLEAEQSILGCIINRADTYDTYVMELSEDDFYVREHKAIHRALRKAKAEQLAIDLVTVGDILEQLFPNAVAKVTSAMIDCAQRVQYTNVDSYLRTVKELSVRRKAITLIAEIQKELQDPSKTINGIMDRLRTEAGDMLVSKHSWMTMTDVLLKTFSYIEQRVKGEVKSITTGIPNVDAIIGGFFGGELTIIGARPAVGKSVFGMNVALEAAARGFKVGICSREMTDIQYGQRILSYESRIDGMKIRKAQIEAEDWMPITKALSSASRLPIEFLFTVRTVEDLRAETQRKVNQGQLDMLIVDYLQLLAADQRFKEDRLRVGYISRALKDIALDFNIPVVALAQVKRYAGGARAKMPTLEGLKDSGSLEQDADGVIFLHNPFDAEDDYVDPRDKEYFHTYEKQGFTYLCIGVAKQRQGSTGKACVLFEKKTMRYFAIDREKTP